MRKQIAAANWKMNLSLQEAETLLDKITGNKIELTDNQLVIFSVPAPYLHMAQQKIEGLKNNRVAAQNVYSKMSGAYTGEISVGMLNSIGVDHAIIGHSERRELFFETNEMLAEKIRICLDNKVNPIFCCGEALEIREANNQNDYVAKQLEESLWGLSPEDLQQVVIAYEPIWAIGTGKTATSEQAQEMHAHIRSVLAFRFGKEIADNISILYGGSVKASNAKEIFSQPDVDGGLVGGASLIAEDFVEIIKALK